MIRPNAGLFGPADPGMDAASAGLMQMFIRDCPKRIRHGEGGNHENLRRTGLVGEPGLWRRSSSPEAPGSG